MPFTPKEIEVQLEELREGQKKLERRLRSGRGFTDNPMALSTDLDDLGSVKTYLTIEKPDQVPGTPPADVYYLYGYRTRRMQMTATGLISSVARWPDGAANSLIWGVRVPVDWVTGTDVILNVQVRPRANGLAIMRSYITAWADGETEVPYNIEDAANINVVGVTDVVQVKPRTIAGAALQAGDTIIWNILRNGPHADDTMGGNLDAFYGAWIEYTAEF